MWLKDSETDQYVDKIFVYSSFKQFCLPVLVFLVP